MLLRASHKIIAVRAFLDTRMGVEPIVTGIFSPHSTAELRGIYTRRKFVDSVRTVVLAHSFVIELLYAPLPLAGISATITEPGWRPLANKQGYIFKMRITLRSAEPHFCGTLFCIAVRILIYYKTPQRNIIVRRLFASYQNFNICFNEKYCCRCL